VRTLVSVDAIIPGRRLELEAYACGALYVRLGGGAETGSWVKVGP